MNGKTIVALYDDLSSAERVLGELETAGLRHDFTMMGADSAKLSAMNTTGSSSGGWRHASTFGDDSNFNSRDNRVSSLTRMGVTRGDAEIFAEGVRRGGVLLVGRVEDTRCDEALDIIERHGPVDIQHRGQSYRESGWTGYDTTATDYDETQATEERTRWGTGLGAAAASFRDTNVTGTQHTTHTTDTTHTSDTDMTRARADLNVDRADTGHVGTGRDEHIPIVEEQLNVGKRTVERGSVRVRSYVIETPVEEQVRLRDESVVVERRAVDREVGEVPADAFRERTIEVTETDEEAVVQKTAHIREEVVIRKESEERAQTVSDTVRRTEVEIDDNRTGGTDRPIDRDRDRLAGDRPLDRDPDDRKI